MKRQEKRYYKIYDAINNCNKTWFAFLSFRVRAEIFRVRVKLCRLLIAENYFGIFGSKTRSTQYYSTIYI